MSNPGPIYPDLGEKVIAITGGASGIGAALVAAFREQGCKVVFFDRDQAAGEALAGKLGSSVAFRSLDLVDLEKLRSCFAEAASLFGPFDVLINNAAHDDRHSIEDLTPGYWRERLAINLDHHFFAAQAVIQAMREKQKGAIINMSSIAWRVGLANAPAYVTAKAAIEGLTHSLARELGPSGIRVNCVLPGFVRTRRQVENWLTPEFQETVFANQCLKRFIEPEDIAAMVVMLASDSAGAITNQTFVVDAGWS